MELVGRSAEIGEIEKAVAAARAGETRTVAVVGEAGIGKSALLDATAAMAERAGMTTLRGRAAEHEREVPFGLVVDALDDHVSGMHPSRLEAVGPELGVVLPAVGDGAAPPPAGATERFRLHRTLRSLLELLGRERPVALLLDDLHWADEASVELVLHLLRRPPRVGFLLVLGMRPGSAVDPVRDAGRRSDGWLELRPDPLDREAALSLLPADLDARLRERLLDTAAGNPLFLEQLARHSGDQDVPETLAAAVRGELAPLSAAGRELAEGAAIAGDPFELDVAVAAAGAESGAAIDELVAAGLVHGDGGRRFRFRHPLVHRAIADSVPPGRRLEAHERAAAALAEAGAAPTLRAHHVAEFARPGDAEAVALLLEAAAAAERTAPRTAGRWYGAALTLLPHDDAERRAEIVTPMAAALAAAGDLVGARATIEEGIGILGPERAAQRAELTAVATTVEILLGQFDAAGSRVVAALVDAPPAQRPRLLLQRCGIAFFTGEVAEVLDWARRAEEELDADAPPSLWAATKAQLGLGLALRGESGGADQLLEAAGILAEDDDPDPVLRAEAFWTAGGNLVQIERYPTAVTVLGRGLRIARETHQEHLVGHLHVLLAMAELPLLRLDDALEHGLAAEEIARLQTRSFDLGFALSVKARTLALRGDTVAAERAAVESDELVGEAGAPVTRSVLAHNAVVRSADDPERLLAELARIAGPDLERLNPPVRAAIAVPATRAALALDRQGEAEKAVRAAAGAVRDDEPPVSAMRARRAAAEIALARGRTAVASQAAEGIAAEAVAAGARQEELEADFLRARAWLAGDRRDDALEALQGLATAAAEVGAAALRDAAARELRRAGTRVTTRARRGTEGGALTGREREIAELVAGGRSNKQVAAALFVSEKTVERHLSAIYARLGIRSRVELPRALDEARGSDQTG
ncbi:MAG TPA: AAA family ATPase [Solirubrobacterales bacterium]|nr:AAA family ATPase [Solirubrobacterales bacterium]